MVLLVLLLLLELLAQLLCHVEAAAFMNNGSDGYQVINGRHRHHIRTAGDIPSFDCWSFLSIFQHKMNGCHRKNKQHMVLVYVCTIFRGEVDAIISFIVYHLSLGVSHITVYYSSDRERSTWFNHPTLTCLKRHGLVSLVERSTIRHVRSAVSSDHSRAGLRDDHDRDHDHDDDDRAYGDHCFSEDHLSSWKGSHAAAATTTMAWGAMLLLYDMVVLSHRLKCIGELFYNASSSSSRASLAMRTYSFLPDEEEGDDTSLIILTHHHLHSSSSLIIILTHHLHSLIIIFTHHLHSSSSSLIIFTHHPHSSSSLIIIFIIIIIIFIITHHPHSSSSLS